MLKSNVMIVEDEVLSAMNLSASLVELGYPPPQLAATGESALAQVSAQLPDMILMDIDLGREPDGIETAQRILRLHPDIPIVFLTAFSDNTHFFRAQAVYPYGYLIKPYKTLEVHSTIQLTLHKHHLFNRVQDGIQGMDTWFDTLEQALIVIRNNTIFSFNQQARSLFGLEAPGRDSTLSVQNLVFYDADVRFDLSLFLLSLQALDRPKRLPGDLTIERPDKTRQAVTGTLVSFFSENQDQVVCLLLSRREQTPPSRLTIKTEVLKEMLDHRIIFGELSNRLKPLDIRKTTPCAAAPIGIDTVTQRLQDYLTAYFTQGKTEEMRQPILDALEASGLTAHQFIFLYTSVLSELCRQHPDLNDRSIFAELRFACIEILVAWHAINHPKRSTMNCSRFDLPGQILALTAPPDQLAIAKTELYALLGDLKSCIQELTDPLNEAAGQGMLRILETGLQKSTAISHYRLTALLENWRYWWSPFSNPGTPLDTARLLILNAALEVGYALVKELDLGVQSSVRVTEILDRLTVECPAPPLCVSTELIGLLSPFQTECLQLAHACGRSIYRIGMDSLSVSTDLLSGFGEILFQTETYLVFASRESARHLALIFHCDCQLYSRDVCMATRHSEGNPANCRVSLFDSGIKK